LYLQSEVVGELFAELDHCPAGFAAGVLVGGVVVQTVAGLAVSEAFPAGYSDPAEECQSPVDRGEINPGGLDPDTLVHLLGGQEMLASLQLPGDDSARTGQALAATLECVFDPGCQDRFSSRWAASEFFRCSRRSVM
jgi:hypothetical protein